MQQRYDLYGTIHKGLRRELAIMLADLGAIDTACDQAVADVAGRLRALVAILFSHAHHEDKHLGPHLRRLVPALHAEMEHEHVALDAALAELDAAAVALSAHGDRRSAAKALYLQLTEWTARCFLHMHREETAYTAAFHAAYTDAEIGEIEHALVSDIAPTELGRIMEIMMLAMSEPDRRAFAAQAVAA